MEKSERKRSWPNLSYYSGIRLEGPGLDSKGAPPRIQVRSATA
jgi:hypothetical protein